jgi:LacI family transcriptional regulator
MASIKDVAVRAGVSVASVSRVLNDSKPVSPQTRARVLQAVNDLHYSIDQRARALRRQQSGTLGLVVAEVRNPFFTEAIHSIEAVAYEHNYRLLLCNSDEDPERERLHLEALIAQRIGGIIVMPVTQSGRSLLSAIHHGIPLVCLDRRVEDLEVDSVLVDNIAGVRQAVAHLVALGHRRIGHIGGRVITPTLERLTGYRQELAAWGIAEEEVLVRIGPGVLEDSGYREALALLDLPNPPTAIFVNNSPLALGTLAAVRDRGLHIPEEISVVGFDDAPWSALLDPPLTLVAQPTDALGRAAASLLVERVERRSGTPTRHIVLPPRLVVRASTAPPRADALVPWMVGRVRERDA